MSGIMSYLIAFCSVAQSCLTLCDPMDCSTPDFPVLYRVPEFAQTHVHWVGDAIQTSYPLSSPYPPTFNLSQDRVFSNESVLHIRWPEYWSFSFSINPSNEYSGLISFRINWFYFLANQCSPPQKCNSLPSPFHSISYWNPLWISLSVSVIKCGGFTVRSPKVESHPVSYLP